MEKSINKICDKYGISYLAIFGSLARGEADEKSDIDLLVEYSKPVTLFDLSKIEDDFEEHFGRKVDLVSKKSLSPYLKDRVLKEAKVIYAQPR